MPSSPHRTQSWGDPPPPGYVLHVPPWGSRRAPGPNLSPCPFVLSDLSQVKQKLGSYSSDPMHFIKECGYFTVSYDLTWRNLYISLSTCLYPEEKGQVWLPTQAHADTLNRQDSNNGPVGATAVPREKPDWDCQEGRPGRQACSHMIHYLPNCGL